MKPFKILKKLLDITMIDATWNNTNNGRQLEVDEEKQGQEFLKRLSENTEKQFRTLYIIVSWFGFVSPMLTCASVLLIIFNANRFRKKWLLKDHFQNDYLTETLFRIDMYKKKAAAKSNNFNQSVLPLRKAELKRYKLLEMHFVSMFALNKREKKFLLLNLPFALTHISFIILLVISDWISYYYNDAIANRLFKDMTFESQVSSTIITNNEDNSTALLSDIKRLSEANQVMGIVLKFSACKPHLSAPNRDAHVLILSMTLVYVFLQILKPWCNRMQHIIMIKNYPKRATERAYALRQMILAERGHSKISNAAQRFYRKLPKCVTNILSSGIKKCELCQKVAFSHDKLRIKNYFQQCENDNCQKFMCNTCIVAEDNKCFFCHMPFITMTVDLQECSSDEDFKTFLSRYAQ